MDASQVVRRYELKPGDFERRRIFCRWFLSLEEEERMNFLVSDEANFEVSGHVNSRNVARYSLDRYGRPDQHVVEKVTHSQKAMVFAGLRKQSLITLHFLSHV